LSTHQVGSTTISPAPAAIPIHHAVPSATVARFEGLTGIDLGFVPVNRAPTVRRTASEIGARAYTHSGTVHMPDDLGELDRIDNEGLLLHELAHVAQERRGAESADLEDWERQAALVERAFRGEPVPDDWSHTFEQFTDVPMHSWSAESGFVRDQPTTGAGPVVQRRPLFEAASPAELPPETVAAPGVPELVDTSQARELVYATAGNTGSEPSHGEPEPPTSMALRLDDDDLEAVAARVREGLVVPALDVDDPITLERLAHNLYGHVRGLLRQELLVDRERSGVLTEFQEE